MTLSLEALQRATENAAAAPPFPSETKEQIRLILWGTVLPAATGTEQVSEEAA